MCILSKVGFCIWTPSLIKIWKVSPPPTSTAAGKTGSQTQTNRKCNPGLAFWCKGVPPVRRQRADTRRPADEKRLFIQKRRREKALDRINKSAAARTGSVLSNTSFALHFFFMASLSDKSNRTKVLFFPFLLALALSRVQRSQRRGFAVLSLTHTLAHAHKHTAQEAWGSGWRRQTKAESSLGVHPLWCIFFLHGLWWIFKTTWTSKFHPRTQRSR